jgi:hypothetical protein
MPAGPITASDVPLTSVRHFGLLISWQQSLTTKAPSLIHTKNRISFMNLP